VIAGTMAAISGCFKEVSHLGLGQEILSPATTAFSALVTALITGHATEFSKLPIESKKSYDGAKRRSVIDGRQRERAGGSADVRMA
jgi:hypothetical protein